MRRNLRLHLFVYGTLQPRSRTSMAQWMGKRLLQSQPASVPGRLFAIRAGSSWFPALVPAKSGARVWGTLCELALAPGDLARLDRYEGREYRRVCLPVLGGNGRRARAQLYLWRIPLPSKSPAIARGDFLGWLHMTRRRSFSMPRGGV